MTTRNTVTGRFMVDTSNAPESSAGKFPTRRRIPVEDWSAVDTMPGMEVPRYAPESDDLAPGGPLPMHRRIATLVPPEDDASTVYGNRQGALTRGAARRQGGDMDPIGYLTGAEA